MKITLLGYMGSGKTTLAKALAQTLNLNLIDLDAEIEKHTGYTITETIFNKGELYFRKVEREILKRVLGQDNFVLSTGGGTPCYYDNIDLINTSSMSVYLSLNVGELYQRLKEGTAERPLLAHLSGEALQEYIGKHLFERRPFYEQAIFTIKVGDKTTEQLNQELKELLHD